MSKQRGGTEHRILNAAEKLFASKGFGGTSIRMIVREAGVNTASVHYHFGSKEKLIEAVLIRRATPINEERLRLLEELEAAHADGDLPLEGVIEAFITPAIRMRFDVGKSGDIFRQVLGRAITELDESIFETVHKIFDPVLKRFLHAFRCALPGIEAEELIWRMHFMAGAMGFAMASGKRKGFPVGIGHKEQGTERLIERLTKFIAGGMRAPVSQEVGGKQE